MTDKELMQQALEALIDAHDDTGECLNNALPHAGYTRYDRRIASYQKRLAQQQDLITTLRERLAQPDPEPVAWMYTLEYGGSIADNKVSLHQLNYPFGVCGADYLRENSDGISYVRQTPLYTSPQPRQWAGLTEDAVMQMARDAGLNLEPTRNMLFEVRGQHAQLINLARAIEAALKEKNT